MQNQKTNYSAMVKNKKEKPDDLTTALDCAVRDASKLRGGYKIGEVSYCNYMTNDDWSKFYEGINPSHKKQFDDGSGGELKEKKYPPKMASFGSSSRLIYDLSHKIKGFSFEAKLDTRVGGIAHLDGFLKREENYIYVEAKKREIYGASHENESIKKVYLDVYERIHEECKEFSIENIDSDKDEYSKVTFMIEGKPVQYFDLKQLICHFLGITYDIAKHFTLKSNVKFLYLIYNPIELKESINEKYKEKLLKRYDDVHEFIERCISKRYFSSIFQSVLNYQVKTQNLRVKPEISFEMKLVDQNSYIKEF